MLKFNREFLRQRVKYVKICSLKYVLGSVKRNEKTQIF